MKLKTTNLMMFKRCINYMFISILRIPRTYIYILLTPIIFITALYSLLFTNIHTHHRDVVISSLILLPILFDVFLVSYLISDWRESVFLKQLNNFGLNRIQFILALLITIFTISFVRVLILIGYLFIIDSFKSYHIMQNWVLELKTFSQWFGIFFSIFLNILVIFFMSVFVSGTVKNPYLAQTLNLIIVIISFFLGDFLIDMYYSRDSITITLSYFVPQKYLTWIAYIFYTQSDKFSYNFFLIVPQIDSRLSFTSVYTPVFCSLIFLTIFSVGSSYYFLYSNKR